MTMKKTLTLLLVLVLAVAAMALPVAAATAGKEDTEATVTFAPDPSGPGGATLYLDHVPTLDFGSHTISANDETYTATPSSDKLLRVVDSRGSGAGWNVTANIEDSFTGQTTGSDLAGSRITITNGTVSYGATAATPPPAPTQPNSIILNNSGEPAAIFTAAKGQGKGIWLDDLDVVHLEVPGSAALAEAYKATIVWTLSDVPA